MRLHARYTISSLTLAVFLLSSLSAFAGNAPPTPIPPTLTYTATPFTSSISFTATTTFSKNQNFQNGPYGLGFTNGNSVLSGQAPEDIAFTYHSTGYMTYQGTGNLSGQAPETSVPAGTNAELIHFALTGFENAPNTSPFYIYAYGETQFEAEGGQILASVYPLGWTFISDFHHSTPTDPIEPDDPLDFYVIATIPVNNANPDGFHAYQSDNFFSYSKPFIYNPQTMTYGPDPTSVVTPLDVTPQSAVPEPGSFVSFTLGGLGLIGLAVRKRRSRS